MMFSKNQTDIQTGVDAALLAAYAFGIIQAEHARAIYVWNPEVLSERRIHSDCQKSFQPRIRERGYDEPGTKLLDIVSAFWALVFGISGGGVVLLIEMVFVRRELVVGEVLVAKDDKGECDNKVGQVSR